MKKAILILLVSCIGLSAFAQKKEKEKKKSKKELKAEAQEAKNKLLLRYNLKKGDTYEQVMEIDSKNQIMGMEIPQVQKITTKVLVTDVDAEKNITQENTIEKFYMKQINPMAGELEYDSEDASKQNSMLSEQLKGVKGTKSILKMTSTGKILEAPKEAGMSGFSGQYPEQAVAIGETWEASNTVKNSMLGSKEIISQNQYKLVARNNGKAVIEVTGKILSDGKEIGNLSGKMTIDEATGITLESTLLQKMNIEIQGMEAQIESNIKLFSKKP